MKRCKKWAITSNNIKADSGFYKCLNSGSDKECRIKGKGFFASFFSLLAYEIGGAYFYQKHYVMHNFGIKRKQLDFWMKIDIDRANL